MAEILVEAGELLTGVDILILGPTTGVVEGKVTEIRLDLHPVSRAIKGQTCSVPVPGLVRRGDKLYLWVETK